MQREAGGRPVDEADVLRRALGERRGCTRGIGRKVRNLPPDVSCVSNSQISVMEE
jgi:hypothetical protein